MCSNHSQASKNLNGSPLSVVRIVKLVRTGMVDLPCVISIIKLVRTGTLVSLCVVSIVKLVRTEMVVPCV